MKLRDFTFAAIGVLGVIHFQTACSSHEAPSGQSTLELRAAGGTAAEIACTGSEVHPQACCSNADGCYLVGLDEDHPPCFEHFEEVLASDVCCSSNGAARPTCRGATVSWSPPQVDEHVEPARPSGRREPNGK